MAGERRGGVGGAGEERPEWPEEAATSGGGRGSARGQRADVGCASDGGPWAAIRDGDLLRTGGDLLRAARMAHGRARGARGWRPE